MIKNSIANAIYILLVLAGIVAMVYMFTNNLYYQKLDIAVIVVFIGDMALIRYLLPKDMVTHAGLYTARLLVDFFLIASAVILFAFHS